MIGSYRLYLRYNFPTKEPIYQLLPDRIDWNELLNMNEELLNEKSYVNMLEVKHLYILNNQMVMYMGEIPDIKVLVFDVVVPTTGLELAQAQTGKYNGDYKDFRWNVDNDETADEISELLKKQLPKVSGDVEVK